MTVRAVACTRSARFTVLVEVERCVSIDEHGGCDPGNTKVAVAESPGHAGPVVLVTSGSCIGFAAVFSYKGQVWIDGFPSPEGPELAPTSRRGPPIVGLRPICVDVPTPR
jgi:hypothetical protein